MTEYVKSSYKYARLTHIVKQHRKLLWYTLNGVTDKTVPVTWCGIAFSSLTYGAPLVTDKLPKDATLCDRCVQKKETN